MVENSFKAKQMETVSISIKMVLYILETLKIQFLRVMEPWETSKNWFNITGSGKMVFLKAVGKKFTLITAIFKEILWGDENMAKGSMSGLMEKNTLVSLKKMS